MTKRGAGQEVCDFAHSLVERFEMNGPSHRFVSWMAVAGIGTYCGAGVDDCSGLGCG